MAKIVIIDDDPSVVEACRLFLEKEGHQVDSAFNREEGMTLLNAAPHDLLILDVMMEQPDDGIAMAQELRNKGFELPILMLTSICKATGLNYDRDDVLVPVDAFEEKPITPKRLIMTVKDLLERKEKAEC